MQGTVDGFSHGLVTPVAAYLMACLGGALGLRCTARSLTSGHGRKTGWLALGATAIGSGVWTMHFIGMTGFTVREAPVTYDAPLTYASLGVAVVMAGIGVFIVGYQGATAMALVTGGAVTGLGIASMHYLGMAGMRLRGRLEYDTLTVGLSVVIAVVGATFALWAAVSVRGLLPGLGAGLVMGLAVSGMHYTGMAALDVHLHGPAGAVGGETPLLLLAPVLIGPVVFLFLAGVAVMSGPLLVRARPGRRRPAGAGASRPVPGTPRRR
ncbi:MHYT domain-containing protein [Streptomyces sp. Wb2n-11]|uniref:MHYT domain-containing protein n=1 Tax=Streptomyces sp. Wb2n-11 TaxID=1030533 RepID=UPI000A95B2F9|nr:MHYT domain-containing protein [Streptomyces sp. Wb2n-11]